MEKDDRKTNDIEFKKDKIEELSENEKDVLGEVGNISMGTAATTLSELLRRPVNITTPNVSVVSSEELIEGYQKPFVAIDIKYKSGLEGSNVLILNLDDAKIITDLMMGKENFDTERDLSELDLSAVGEAMNQMMGSASTSLSSMLLKPIDINPPITKEMSFSKEVEIDMLKTEPYLIRIAFRMIVGDIIDSHFMQLFSVSFGKNMINDLMKPMHEELVDKAELEIKHNEQLAEGIDNKTKDLKLNSQQNMMLDRKIGESEKYKENVVIKKPAFQAFNNGNVNKVVRSIDAFEDIPIRITVELGKAVKNVSDILKLGQGTVIELNKLVGDPLDIYANEKLIAHGEVVIIDDNFGIRVTEVEKPKKKNN